MIPEILLWTNLSLLFIHELDAVRNREWNMFFLLNRLGDETAHRIFSGLHFFLFFGVFFLLRYNFYILFFYLNFFLIFHVFLHILFERHKNNQLKGLFSRFIIYAMGIVALASLAWYYGIF